jgi:hypothetical protein
MLLHTKNNGSLSLPLRINAKEQQKHQEFLPPKEKAAHQTQRNQHLTEDKKKIAAQIRSVAAILNEKVDLDQQTVEFLREHFDKDPALALAYYHCCSTDPHAAIFNDKLRSDDETSAIWNCISNLIGSPIGQKETVLCQETFKNLD